MEYLYQEGDAYVFMDSETYEQTHLQASAIEEALPYLIPNLPLKVDFYAGEPVGIELPTTVDLEVVDTEPGLKGATASASSKPATLTTGLVVNVPQFVDIGDTVRVETASGAYVTRV
jgi:elongation factor P